MRRVHRGERQREPGVAGWIAARGKREDSRSEIRGTGPDARSAHSSGAGGLQRAHLQDRALHER